MKKKNTSRIHAKKTIEKYTKKSMLLGSKHKDNVIHLLNYRLLLELIILISLSFIPNYGIILAIITTIAFHFGISYLFFDYRIKKRTIKLESEIIEFLEILSLTLNAGHNINVALEITTNALDSAISLEFKKVLEDTKLGKKFSEALDTAKKRIPSEDINIIILSINEAIIYGNSIINILNNGIEYFQDKKIGRIKGEINKLPIKLSTTSVLFFIPIILLLILSPVIINLILG